MKVDGITEVECIALLQVLDTDFSATCYLKSYYELIDCFSPELSYISSSVSPKAQRMSVREGA